MNIRRFFAARRLRRLTPEQLVELLWLKVVLVSEGATNSRALDDAFAIVWSAHHDPEPAAAPARRRIIAAGARIEADPVLRAAAAELLEA